jgi:benzoyl-CoA reductase/2-hydroxyglutaryl-CoA dehydratase subunit BcrC/BadD/HgdB
LVARLGGQLVGDYHALGDLMIGAPMPGTGSPLRRIVEHYHRGVFSTRTYPQDAEAVARFAKAAGARGVVFYYYAEEEALTWELPAQRRALQAHGLGSISFDDQPYAFDAARVHDRLSEFIGELARGRAA